MQTFVYYTKFYVLKGVGGSEKVRTKRKGDARGSGQGSAEGWRSHSSHKRPDLTTLDPEARCTTTLLCATARATARTVMGAVLPTSVGLVTCVPPTAVPEIMDPDLAK